MRVVRWVPFTFLAGLHGFALFAPYAAVVMTIFLISLSLKKYALSR